jgi:hypothetical protein
LKTNKAFIEASSEAAAIEAAIRPSAPDREAANSVYRNVIRFSSATNTR